MGTAGDVEESFGIDFTSDELVAAETVGLLAECITRKLGRADHSGRGFDAAEVFVKLRRLIAAEIGVKEERITLDTAFPVGLKIY